MFKMLPLLIVSMALTAPTFAGEKHCPKGEVRDYSCAPGTGPGSQGNKACKKVYGKCVAKEPAPK